MTTSRKPILVSELRRTSLYETHKAAGAALVPFAGWEMPVSYPLGTVKEVAATRTGAGLFDVSHMGEFRIHGGDARDFVQRLTTNDARALFPGKAQYSLLLNEDGGIIDDIIVYCRALHDYTLVVNAGRKEQDWRWLEAQSEQSLDRTLYGHLEDLSDQTALLAVQGPAAVGLVAGLCVPEVATLARFEFGYGPVGGVLCILSRTGYTGEDGYELFCPWDDAPALWDKLTAAGAVPCGLGARDVLRLEAAYSLYGHELDDAHTPAESGVAWAMKRKDVVVMGQDAARARPVSQTLVGLRMDERAIPREGCAVLGDDGMPVGSVTSGTYSPTVKAGIAMARLDISHAAIGTRVIVDIRGRQAGAGVVRLPFYRNGV